MLEAHAGGLDSLLRHEGEASAIRICLNEVRYVADVLDTMAAETAGHAVGDEAISDDWNPA